MSTVDRIAAIKYRLTFATPGPWNERTDDWDCVLPHTVKAEESYVAHVSTHDDLELIANAPGDLQWLLDQLEATEARAAAAEARLDRERAK